MDTHNTKRLATVQARSGTARDILRHIASGDDAIARDQLMSARDRVRVLAGMVREISYLPLEAKTHYTTRLTEFCDKLARELL